MRDSSRTIANIPTNVITGFLGVGETSAVLHLLKHKPPAERWAVLVNEFGEIGVDGSFFAGRHDESGGVFIKEVPGGCMCCAAGLPMQMALNILLRQARPDRLLIEPTGLGHPIEVLGVLSGKHYQDVLSIQKVLTLVDARKLMDERYTGHETFNQQIAIADVIVGNKTDLYGDDEIEALEAYAKEKGTAGARVVFTEQGVLEPGLLEGATAATAHGHHHHEVKEPSAPLDAVPIPESGYVTARNQGEGFHSIGWRIVPERVFDRTALITFLKSLKAERMKAVFITADGVFGYNLTSDALNEMELDDCMESRMEIIAGRIDDDWERKLFECLVPEKP